MLGIWRYKLAFYYKGSKGKDNKFNNWLKNTIGEPPVFYSQAEQKNTADQMTKYLNKKGYFDAEVFVKPRFKKRTTKVEYQIDLGKPYTINQIQYIVPDTNLQTYIFSDTINSLVKEKQIYDAYQLDDEATRITNFLRNKGFYYFSREFVLFEVNSNLRNRKMNIYVRINDQTHRSPEANKEIEEHKLPQERYFINKVIINPDYQPLGENRFNKDTTLIKLHQGKKNTPTSYYYFVKDGKFRVKPRTITQSTFISEHQAFSLNNLQRTYRRLSNQSIFRYVNIRFDTIIQERTLADSSVRLLNCYINLQRAPSQSRTFEIEGTNSGGAFGLGGNVSYQNKNIFRGAEVFNIKLFGRLQRVVTGEDNAKSNLYFNNIEYGINTSVSFPNFLLPIRQERFPKFFEPTTTFKIGYTAQNRPSYNRFITNGAISYEWKSSETSSHSLLPSEVSSIKVKGISPETLDTLDPRTRAQFTNHLILDSRYTYVYTNQVLNKPKNFFYIKGSFEAAGGILNLGSMLFDSKKNNNGKYTLFGIEYAQYLRTDIDFRYYNYIDPEDILVFRVYLGLGLPYSNSNAMPYEKAFVAGGANGMRGWGFRELGPGSYSGTLAPIDRIGDMQIEGNFEYRFPIYKSIKGALFSDIGNIWLIRQSEDFPGGFFNLKNFWEEMAWDAGLGLRYDFQYFIIRLDGAVRLRNPAKPRNQRWVVKDIDIRGIYWNFAIGLPF